MGRCRGNENGSLGIALGAAALTLAAGIAAAGVRPGGAVGLDTGHLAAAAVRSQHDGESGIELVAEHGGQVHDVTSDSQWAYAALGSRLAVLDRRFRVDAEPLGVSRPAGAQLRALAAAGQGVVAGIVGDGPDGQLLVYRTDEPSSPRWVGTLALRDTPAAVAAHGGRAWVALGTRVAAVDLSIPERPRILGRTALPRAVTHLGATEDTVVAVTAGGQGAERLEGSLLVTLEAGSTAAPRELGRRAAEGVVTAMALDAGWLAVVQNGGMLELLARDGSREWRPVADWDARSLSVLGGASQPIGVALSEGRLWLGRPGRGLATFELDEAPGGPILTASMDGAKAVALAAAPGGGVLLGRGPSGLERADVDGTTIASHEAAMPTGYWTSVAGGEAGAAWAVGRAAADEEAVPMLHRVPITGTAHTVAPAEGIVALARDGSRLYGLTEQELWAWDVSVPSAPGNARALGEVPGSGRARAIAGAAGGWVLLADGIRSTVLAITPLTIVGERVVGFLGCCTLPALTADHAWGLASARGHATRFVALDALRDFAPVEPGFVLGSGSPAAVRPVALAVEPPLAVLLSPRSRSRVNTQSDLTVLDVSRPAQPRLAGSIDLPGAPGSVAALRERIAWLSTGRLERTHLAAFDLERPGLPDEIGWVPVGDAVVELSAAGDAVWLVTQDGRLLGAQARRETRTSATPTTATPPGRATSRTPTPTAGAPTSPTPPTRGATAEAGGPAPAFLPWLHAGVAVPDAADGMASQASARSDELRAAAAQAMPTPRIVGGMATAIGSDERHLLLAVGPRLRLFDATDPFAEAIGDTAQLTWTMSALAVDAGLAVAVADATRQDVLLAVELEGPGAPRVVGQLGLGTRVSRVDLDGRRAWLLGTGGDLFTVDLRDASRPRVEARWSPPGAGGGSGIVDVAAGGGQAVAVMRERHLGDATPTPTAVPGHGSLLDLVTLDVEADRIVERSATRLPVRGASLAPVTLAFDGSRGVVVLPEPGNREARMAPFEIPMRAPGSFASPRLGDWRAAPEGRLVPGIAGGRAWLLSDTGTLTSVPLDGVGALASTRVATWRAAPLAVANGQTVWTTSGVDRSAIDVEPGSQGRLRAHRRLPLGSPVFVDVAVSDDTTVWAATGEDLMRLSSPFADGPVQARLDVQPVANVVGEVAKLAVEDDRALVISTLGLWLLDVGSGAAPRPILAGAVQLTGFAAFGRLQLRHGMWFAPDDSSGGWIGRLDGPAGEAPPTTVLHVLHVLDPPFLWGHSSELGTTHLNVLDVRDPERPTPVAVHSLSSPPFGVLVDAHNGMALTVSGGTSRSTVSVLDVRDVRRLRVLSSLDFGSRLGGVDLDDRRGWVAWELDRPLVSMLDLRRPELPRERLVAETPMLLERVEALGDGMVGLADGALVLVAPPSGEPPRPATAEPRPSPTFWAPTPSPEPTRMEVPVNYLPFGTVFRR